MAEWGKIKKSDRIYAIGDIHGRADLFEQLLGQIRQDNAARSPARTSIILLGDLVDRGPQSAAVVARAMRYEKTTKRFIVLKGNHEQVMAAALQGNLHALKGWLAVGGTATLRSWGVPEEYIVNDASSKLISIVRHYIDIETVDWLEHLPTSVRSGGVLFVHAGVRPNVKLAKQAPNDLMWIGDEFLQYEARHPALIIHGHSISEEGVVHRPNRIGIDTGAYRSGRLTALGMEGGAHWTLATT